ncbi:DNA-processing protein DprA [Desulfohalobium retbaense]|uniref:DNA protecting protein DprA n=1 Tax=Desulfohalobium retbaense (strain ATCC 49708 / DSM 5692 / JCM 16813 / HR100) TaxID=485915 RepID=C8X184_DESRD|nr:DNA-processing protein DprA [Desulfohalobium retbaense]ACV68181.1 DNA protecting protein DprA [Desulfohalobium retbaense DSM 5692]
MAAPESLAPSERAEELWACLALRYTPGLGPKTQRRLFDAYGSARRAVADAAHWGQWDWMRPQAVAAFTSRKWEQEARREWDAARRQEMRVVLWSEDQYPVRLREIEAAPPFVYAYGDTSLLHAPCVAMVGSRQCSRYGKKVARALAADLAQAGITVVSGFAQGIDSHAHTGALNGVGSSVAVMGTGLDIVYPARQHQLWQEVAAHGCLISEFAPGTPPEPKNFPRRNRIISGLSLAVVVVEAALQSGSLITAQLALEQDREVFVVPGSVLESGFAGGHALLRDGARLVRNAEDIVQDLGPMVSVTSPRPGALPLDPPQDRSASELTWRGGSALENAVVARLSEEDRVHVDVFLRELADSSQAINHALLMLEMQEVVEKLPGMYYALAPGVRVAKG